MIVDFLLASVMIESIEQSYSLKLCQKLNNNHTKTIQKTGRPSASRNEEVIEKVCQIVTEDRSLTLKEIAKEVEIN